MVLPFGFIGESHLGPDEANGQATATTIGDVRIAAVVDLAVMDGNLTGLQLEVSDLRLVDMLVGDLLVDANLNYS